MFRKKKVIDYKNSEMLSKFTSQNGRIFSWKYTNNSIWKNISKIKNNLINLKLDPQNIELKNNKNIGSFKVKMHIHPMLETLILPINISKKWTKKVRNLYYDYDKYIKDLPIFLLINLLLTNSFMFKR